MVAGREGKEGLAAAVSESVVLLWIVSGNIFCMCTRRGLAAFNEMDLIFWSGGGRRSYPTLYVCTYVISMLPGERERMWEQASV